MKTWTCELKNSPEKITVGTKLQMFCRGEVTKNLKDKPVHIVFPKKEDEHRLRILKIVSVEDAEVQLEVAPYKSGSFQGSLTITDGASSFIVKNISFQVDSVLKQNQETKAHGPFGPFRESISIWYFSLCGFTFVLFVSIVIHLVIRFFKRKTLIEKISQRQKNNRPSQIFIKAFRKLDSQSKNYILDLEILFQTFLENLFYISAVQKKPNTVLKQIKKYHPVVFKKYDYKLEEILKEFRSLQSKKLTPASFQLEKNSKEFVFLLEQEVKL